MRKQAVSDAVDSPMECLEQVAHLVQSTRSPGLLVERVLQLLGDALEAMAGAVVLTGDTGKRPQEWSWGIYRTPKPPVLAQGREDDRRDYTAVVAQGGQPPAPHVPMC